MGNSDVLLTRRNVEDMKHELSEVLKQRDELSERAEKLTKRLEAASLFLSDDLVEEAASKNVPAPSSVDEN